MKYVPYLDIQEKLIRKAVNLASNSEDDVANILQLGAGWVAEETLAIALYCVLRHFGNFEEAVVASVNHGGDSDSTGAVTGNIIGTIIGYEAIPQFYKDDLELHHVILRVADDLCEGAISSSL